MNQPPRSFSDLETLIRLFYQEPDDCGLFDEVVADDVPQPQRSLLAHNHHMTVTVEAHHRCAVDVEVIATSSSDTHYARKILLRRQDDGRVVQYGIMRVDLNYLEQHVQEEILNQQTPLGRILIQNDVLRQVQLMTLWHIQPGEELTELLSVAEGDAVYGRTALIYCNGEPAIELLEVVTNQ